MTTCAEEPTRECVATDALIGALAGFYKATNQIYIASGHIHDWKGSPKFQDDLDEWNFDLEFWQQNFRETWTGEYQAVNPCGVCAIGAAAIAVICRTNNRTFEDVSKSNEKADIIAEEVFDINELRRMETAFELWYRGLTCDGYLIDDGRFLEEKESGNVAEKWDGISWNDFEPQDRLAAIFANTLALGEFDINRIPTRLPTLSTTKSVVTNVKGQDKIVYDYTVIWPEPNNPMSIFTPVEAETIA